MTTFDDAKKILDRYLKWFQTRLFFITWSSDSRRKHATSIEGRESNGFATICQSSSANRHNSNWQRLEIFELESAA
jgi:hypothetical protein